MSGDHIRAFPPSAGEERAAANKLALRALKMTEISKSLEKSAKWPGKGNTV